MITRLHTNVRMSQAVIHGGVAYLAGQVSEGENVEVQMNGCLAKVDALLEEVGSSREHLLQTTIWLADMADFAEMNAAWDAWVPEGHTPARATGEAKLATPEFKVEVIVIAALK
ncbi:RidA family protein [Planktotalea arctica]|uniref:RidA family protein n=1 Tax=Planktotalea arctica TaxID=1481893 RepID=UPI001C3953EB|nr:RidA family protein [Planktotalea arctica]